MAPRPHLQLLQLLPERHMVKMIMELIKNCSFALTTRSVTQQFPMPQKGCPTGIRLASLLYNIYIYILSTSISQKYAYAYNLKVAALALVYSTQSIAYLSGFAVYTLASSIQQLMILQVVTCCLHPTPLDNLPILTGLQSADLR